MKLEPSFGAWNAKEVWVWRLVDRGDLKGWKAYVALWRRGQIDVARLLGKYLICQSVISTAAQLGAGRTLKE
jgi:hypothetical protein